MTVPHAVGTGLMIIAALCGVAATQGCTVTRSSPPEAVKAAVVDEHTKQLLLLMDRDENGKVSKQEFMNYMSAEFDRLDKDRSGDLDPSELSQLHVGRSRGIPR